MRNRSQARLSDGWRRGALTAQQTAERLGGCLIEADEVTAWRWLIELVDDFRGSAPSSREALVSETPSPIGDSRYDAAMAALVEYLCAEAGLAVPPWTSEPFRFVEPWSFPSGLPGLYASMLRDGPISFKRHGVFVSARAFARA